MRKLIAVVLLAVAFFSVSCGKAPGSAEILGKWKCAALNRTIEFSQDGSLTMEDPMMAQKGTYELKGKNLEIKFETLEAPVVWKVSLSGESLVIVKGKGAGATFTYEKVQ